MEPNIGRIVHYSSPALADERPAIIVAVRNPTRVDLQVFTRPEEGGVLSSSDVIIGDSKGEPSCHFYEDCPNVVHPAPTPATPPTPTPADPPPPPAAG